MRRVNKKLRLTPAAASPALWGRETARTQIFRGVSPIPVLFLLCEGEGAQPGTAADICCSFLSRATQRGANPSPSPWPPAGRGCGHRGARHWGFWGAGTPRAGQRLFWVPLSARGGRHLCLSEPFSAAALSGKSHPVTASPLSLIIPLSTPAPSHSPVSTEQKHAEYSYSSPPTRTFWGTSHFGLPGSSVS